VQARRSHIVVTRR